MFCMMRCMGRRRPGLPSSFRWRCAILGYQVGTVISGGLTLVIAVLCLALGGDGPGLICGYITVLCALSLWASVVACDPVADAKPQSRAEPETREPVAA